VRSSSGSWSSSAAAGRATVLFQPLLRAFHRHVGFPGKIISRLASAMPLAREADSPGASPLSARGEGDGAVRILCVTGIFLAVTGVIACVLPLLRQGGAPGAEARPAGDRGRVERVPPPGNVEAESAFEERGGDRFCACVPGMPSASPSSTCTHGCEPKQWCLGRHGTRLTERIGTMPQKTQGRLARARVRTARSRSQAVPGRCIRWVRRRSPPLSGLRVTAHAGE